MTVDDLRKIDIVALSPDGTVAMLVITDALGWADPDDHLYLLQGKLNGYLAFAESGELVAKFPGAAGRSIKFKIAFANPIPARAKEFLTRAARVVSHAGFDLLWEAPEPTEYANSAPPG